jgi:hypothetical protein
MLLHNLIYEKDFERICDECGETRPVQKDKKTTALLGVGALVVMHVAALAGVLLLRRHK